MSGNLNIYEFFHIFLLPTLRMNDIFLFMCLTVYSQLTMISLVCPLGPLSNKYKLFNVMKCNCGQKSRKFLPNFDSRKIIHCHYLNKYWKPKLTL